MESTESQAPTQLKPPYGKTAWYKAFFDLIRRQKFERIDKEIIGLNIVKGPNATMLFNGIRFLGLIEEDGKVTEKLESLRRMGNEFKQNLRKVIEEAYSDLFSKVVLEKARPDDLFNYFAKYYKYGAAAADSTMKIFVFFCREAEIPISDELATIEIEKRKLPPRKEKRRRAKRGLIPEGEVEGAVPKGIVELKYNKIRMWLPEGDLEAAKAAKDLIDFHIKRLESKESD